MALIDRGRVMADYLENLGRNDSYKAKFEALCKAVDEAPAVDAAPVVHARWVDECDGYRTCSECGCEHPIRDARGYLVDDEYCPACGAKMDGGAKDDV